MKVNMVKPELKLIRILMSLVAKNDMLVDMQQWINESYNIDSDEFNKVWVKLDHKIKQAVGNGVK